MRRPARLLVSLHVLLVMASVLGAAGQQPVSHPRLVSLESTRCTVCHDDLVSGAAVVHYPVEDDCTSCHDVIITEDATSVALMDAEPALCVVCHDELENAVAGDLPSAHFPVADSCLTCHDPHTSGNERLLVDSLPSLCWVCHDLEDLDQPHGGQLTEATDCRSCHDPHGSQNQHMLLASQLHPPFSEGSCEGCHREPFGDRIRLRSRGEKLCLACHGDLPTEAVAGGSLHAALQGERGRAGCLSCHDPHMADQRRLLRAAGPDLCGFCHQPTVNAARAESGHFPAAEDCLTCHRPHDSERRRLLADPAEELCLMCHDAGDEDLTTAHLGADLAALACTQCHTPHGNGNPKLLARVVHGAIEEGCDLCHEGSYDRQLEGGESALCLICHDDIGELAEQAQVPHGALEIGRCVDCHNPHASPQDHLVKLPSGGVCYECHEEVAPTADEVAHGVIDLVGCQACHEPHGGNREKLLRAEGSELCLGCHDPRSLSVEEGAETVKLLDRFEVPATTAKALTTLRLSADGTRGHPVAGHRVIGAANNEELHRVETSFTGELACLSCHDPHRGRSKLLLWNAGSTLEACIHCHPK